MLGSDLSGGGQLEGLLLLQGQVQPVFALQAVVVPLQSAQLVRDLRPGLHQYRLQSQTSIRGSSLTHTHTHTQTHTHKSKPRAPFTDTDLSQQGKRQKQSMLFFFLGRKNHLGPILNLEIWLDRCHWGMVSRSRLTSLILYWAKSYLSFGITIYIYIYFFFKQGWQASHPVYYEISFHSATDVVYTCHLGIHHKPHKAHAKCDHTVTLHCDAVWTL